MAHQVNTVLALAHSLHGAREIHQLVGQPAVEQAVTNLMPLLNEPIVRIALRGDVRKLLSEVLSSVGVLLRAASNQELPEDERVGAFAFALHDIFEAINAYTHDVVVSSGNSSELFECLQWLLESWHSVQRLLDLERLRGSISWERLLAMVHTSRVEGKEHAKLTPAELDALLPDFVRALRGL